LPEKGENNVVRLQQPHQTETKLTGSLLVALPSLVDPNFRRTILFLTHHDQEGAMGFILNRPRNERLGQLASAPEEVADVPVFSGGPVDPKNLILTHLLWKKSGVRFQSLGEDDLSLLDSEKNPQADQTLRAFTGYAGWTGGQLEQEIAEKSWHLLKPTPAILQPVHTLEDGIKLWKGIMKDLGSMYYLLAQAPDDLSRN
jgi:putative transcriptional regulator